jgi:hypothetical protein
MSNDPTARRRKPEEAELENKKADLAQLETELAEWELHLTTLRTQLMAFEGRYLRTVGVLYSELDEIQARIAERLAESEGTEQARRTAARARQQAYESSGAAHGEAAKAGDFVPTQELKNLYREVAKRIHPDLTSDAADRAKRQELMSQANRAYEEGDETTLRQILDHYESSPETVQGEGIGVELIRIIRRITQVKNRLAEIEAEIRHLVESELHQLKVSAHEKQLEGRDLLAEMAAGVRRRIAQARDQLTRIDKKS